MLLSAALVILMSIPGLALFYGGLVRSKNMLSVLMQVFTLFSLICVLWILYGYSLAFTEGNSVYGSFSKALLKGVTLIPSPPPSARGRHQRVHLCGVPGRLCRHHLRSDRGAFAERIKFAAVLLFSVIWFTFAYIPLAHMVWYWAGPDAYTTADAAAAATATAGYLFQHGALDFAGGTVVHINAAVAGLVGAYLVGKRLGYGRDPMTPHSLTMTMIGASLLWFGWFGFNAGSALEANGTAALAFINTWVAPAAAALSWTLAEWVMKGRPSLLGAASGAVSGLVVITPAVSFVGVGGGLVMGLISGVAGLWGSTVSSGCWAPMTVWTCSACTGCAVSWGRC